MDWAEVHGMCDRLAELDPGGIPRGELGDAAVAFERLRNVVEAVDVAVLAQFHYSESWAADGALSGSAWVAARTGSPSRDVHRRQSTGLGLQALPAAGTAAASGRLSPEHLRRLADCGRRHPDLAESHEGRLLVDLAARSPVADFAAAAQHWLAAAEDADEPDGNTTEEQANRPGRSSTAYLSRTLDGVVYLHAVFRDGHGDLAVAAVEARVDQLLRARRDGDPSLTGHTPAELRAEALLDLLGQTQRREPGERSQPDRYRVAVVVRADGDPDHPATIDEAVARCDAPHYRAVLNAASEVLDIGRQTDQWPAAIRRAITLRDGGCTFPGCDRPPSWCDVHHCQWWSQQGETKVDNGALLCRRHHTFLHANGWQATIPKPRAKPEIRQPDGTIHTVKQWPQPDTKTG
jgi:hypothetical protein